MKYSIKSDKGSTEQKCVLTFVGDIMFARKVAVIGEEKGYDYFLNVIKPHLTGDLIVGNLETVVSERGSPNKESLSNFRSSKESLYALSIFDILTLANNHILDYGPESALDTAIAVKDVGIIALGIGETLNESVKPYIAKINGLNIAFYSLTMCRNVTKSQKECFIASLKPIKQWKENIQKVKNTVDFVVALIHFGYELSPYACPESRQEAKAMIDCGANLVIGTGSHVLQGMETYKKGLIFYSLGDFIFDGVQEQRRETGIVQIHVIKQGVSIVDFTPAYIDDTYRPIPLENDPGAKITEKVIFLSKILSNGKNDAFFYDQAKEAFFRSNIRSMGIALKKGGLKAIISTIRSFRLIHAKLIIISLKSLVTRHFNDKRK
ncbi:MAG: CapA family protein [Alphaproteobacteria bacterium]|nr:MAG: CapA family protein [Alphaproteobacteria bacterium]